MPRDPWLSTGIPHLDTALGGGIAAGRLVEVFGPEGGGKTILVLQVGRVLGGRVAFVDLAGEIARHSAGGFGPWFRHFEPIDAAAELEAEFAGTLQAVRVGRYPLVIVDGLDRAESRIDSLGSRAMSVVARKLCALASASGTTVLFTRRPRSTPSWGGNGTAENAMRFYASQRIEVRGLAGCPRARVIKNKLAPPFQSVWLERWEGTGDEAGLWFRAAADQGEHNRRAADWVDGGGRDAGE